MGEITRIEWCDHTFNPWWGCTKVSPACDHCYAETLAKRYGYSETGSQFPIWGKDAQRRFFGEKHWAEPLKWNQDAEREGVRRRVFCASMCDVMEDSGQDLGAAGYPGESLQGARTRLYGLIECTPWIDWLLLTKRPQNFRRFLPKTWLESPRPNVWGMTTVESQEYVWRIVDLLKTPFAVRGLSVEPLLGPLDLKFPTPPGMWVEAGGSYFDASGPGIDWVIVGGESGPGARAMHPDWVRSIRDQCAAAGVAFFFKQWGDYSPKFTAKPGDAVGHSSVHFQDVASRMSMDPSRRMWRVGKKAAGRLLDGREWSEFPTLRDAGSVR